jgi:hypothetical protein
VGPSGRSAARNSLTEPGIPLLKEALEELHTQRHDSLKVEFLSDLAAGLIAMGKHREALTLIVDAIDAAAARRKTSIYVRLVQDEGAHLGISIG